MTPILVLLVATGVALVASRLGSAAAESKSESSGVGTPIDPADVRVGDRVRVVWHSEDALALPKVNLEALAALELP